MTGIKEEDVEEMKRLVSLTSADGGDKAKMKAMCLKYKMGNCNVCLSCRDQVIRMHTRVKNYWNTNKNNIIKPVKKEDNTDASE